MQWANLESVTMQMIYFSVILLLFIGVKSAFKDLIKKPLESKHGQTPKGSLFGFI
jgi:hypothetical protein